MGDLCLVAWILRDVGVHIHLVLRHWVNQILRVALRLVFAGLQKSQQQQQHRAEADEQLPGGIFQLLGANFSIQKEGVERIMEVKQTARRGLIQLPSGPTTRKQAVDCC